MNFIFFYNVTCELLNVTNCILKLVGRQSE